MKGSITIDFTFGLVLVACVSAILFSLCLTMAITEVAQYVAFSSSRMYFGAHNDESWQKKLANQKFQELMSAPPFKILNSRSSWFGLKNSGQGLGPGDHRDMFPPAGDYENDNFWGVVLEFEAKMLNLKFPIIGGVDEDTSFKAKINSFLGREPTFQECSDFVSKRWESIKRNMDLQNPSGQDYYVRIEDNGC